MEKNRDNVKLAIVIFFILISLVIFKLFPTEGKFQDILVAASFFIVSPIFFNKLILKGEFKSFGFKKGDFGSGLKWSGISLLVAALIFYIIFHYTSFVENYEIPTKAAKNFLYFIYYETVLVLGLSFIYEFFFRGFVMFQFSKKIGYWSVLLQYAIFLVLIGSSSYFSWNFMPYIVFAPFAGLIAYKSDSIVYSLVSQSFFIFIIDVFFIKIVF